MGIRMTPQEFPEHRRNDPKRRAEANVFDALQALDLDGYGLYEFRGRRGGMQVDFALWLNDLGRLAGSVKGGHFLVDSIGQWYRRGPDGVLESIPSPLKELVDASIEMRNAISTATGYRNFVAGALFLPDMERDEALERVALNTEHLHIIFGLDNLKEDLERVAAREEFRNPPEPWFSENESSKVNELQFRGPEGSRDDDEETPAVEAATPSPVPGPLDLGLKLGSVTINIQHVETLVIQYGPPERDVEGQTVMCGL